jgi:hypothetical protein
MPTVGCFQLQNNNNGLGKKSILRLCWCFCAFAGVILVSLPPNTLPVTHSKMRAWRNAFNNLISYRATSIVSLIFAVSVSMYWNV